MRTTAIQPYKVKSSSVQPGQVKTGIVSVGGNRFNSMKIENQPAAPRKIGVPGTQNFGIIVADWTPVRIKAVSGAGVSKMKAPANQKAYKGPTIAKKGTMQIFPMANKRRSVRASMMLNK
jgi:hypothetical protein